MPARKDPLPETAIPEAASIAEVEMLATYGVSFSDNLGLAFLEALTHPDEENRLGVIDGLLLPYINIQLKNKDLSRLERMADMIQLVIEQIRSKKPYHRNLMLAARFARECEERGVVMTKEALHQHLDSRHSREGESYDESYVYRLMRWLEKPLGPEVD